MNFFVRISACAAIVLFAGHSALAAEHKDTVYIPERAIILTGTAENGGRENIAVLYSREGLAFDDPSAPRFLFLDRNGKVALGIGGYVKAFGSYDFDGAIDGPGFTTFDIPVPMNPAQRQRFGADASHSTIFLKLATRSERLGRIIVYVQTNFTGDNGGYGLKLKQAYVSVGNFTAGLARSTFVDGESGAPTIDPEGPSGAVAGKNMLFQYKTKSYKGLSAAISIEVPKADYSNVEGKTENIAQRFPDIPLYLQYSWASSSHIRLSGIYRRLSYRDLVDNSNRSVSGWGVQFSTLSEIVGGFGYFGHVAYGKGIAQYVNDLSGMGYDLVPDSEAGRLKAPGTLAWTVGLSYQATPDLFMTASYSSARAYDCNNMTADAYRQGQYITVNAFYNLTEDFKLGAEYIYGKRTDYSRQSGHANRFEAMVQYSF